MDAYEILGKWAEYSKYDPEQKKFNLLSGEYELHSCNDRIARLSEYDPSGALSVIYAKNACESYLREKRVSLFDIADDLDSFKATIEMWGLFCSQHITEVENRFLNGIDQIVQNVVRKKMLGGRDVEAERKVLFSSVNAVVEELSGCNVDLFLRGGPIQPIRNFSTHIHIFEQLADCLLALESAPKDGLYLCYINHNGSAEGYFGLFIKSNGTILAVNERVNEAYPGQHKNSRNGRWSEGKKFRLFPYDYIFSFSEYDYKGYASKHIINHGKLAFFNLEPQVYMPLILAMAMVNTKYTNFDTSEMPMMFVDSMLSVNLTLPTPGTKALVVPESSAIAAVNRALQISMTSQEILDGAYSTRFDWESNKETHYSERGTFPCSFDGQIFIELYGEGFELDTTELLVANRHLKRLTSTELAVTDETPNAEFIGSENRMMLVAYKNAREQLTEYIRDKIAAEYRAFGGRAAVEEWWLEAIQANRSRLFALCADKYIRARSGEEQNVSTEWIDASENPLRFIGFAEDCKGSLDGLYLRRNNYPFNAPKLNKHGRPSGNYLCCLDGTLASTFFVFRFNDWHEIAYVFGADSIPKIVKGWNKQGHQGCGNPILSATDAVTQVGTPFEDRESRRNRRYWTKDRWRGHYSDNSALYPDWQSKMPPDDAPEKSPAFDFIFAVGFSKRGFKRILKNYQDSEKMN